MPLLEVVVNQKYFNQLVVNRFHYVGSGTPAAVNLSFGLISALGLIPTVPAGVQFPTNTLGDAWQGCVSSSLMFVSAFARDLYSVTDFYEVPYPNMPVGDVGGEAMAPFMAYGFTSSRVRTDIRRGSKRFAGVSETTVGAGGEIGSGHMAILQNAVGYLGQTITYTDEGNTLTYSPVILGLVEYTTPSGKRAYKRYDTEALQLQHVAQGMLWSPMPQVRSQVSRQYGRGV